MRAKPPAWFVYAARCSDGSFYTGITTNPARRIKTHNAGKGGAYTRAKRPVELLFQEGHPTRSSALKRELQIKRLPRVQKQVLLVKNPMADPQ